jgi:hypothetical protein
MKFRFARIISLVLFVLVSLFIPLGLYANWFKVTIGDQERFVEIFSSVAANPQIQDSVRDALYVFIDSVDIQGALAENLPETLKPASNLLAIEAKKTLINLSDQLIYSEQFITAWQVMVAETQVQLLMALTGDSTGLFVTEEKGLFITLEPIKSRFIEQVSEIPALSLLAFELENVELPKIEVLNSQQLKFVQLVWNINTYLSIYIWPLVIIMLVFAIYAYGNYFKAVTIAGFTIVAGSLLSLLSIEFIRLHLQAGMSDGFYGGVISEIFAQMTIYLKNASLLVLAVGLAVIITSITWQFIYEKKLSSNFRGI